MPKKMKNPKRTRPSTSRVVRARDSDKEVRKVLDAIRAEIKRAEAQRELATRVIEVLTATVGGIEEKVKTGRDFVLVDILPLLQDATLTLATLSHELAKYTVGRKIEIVAPVSVETKPKVPRLLKTKLMPPVSAQPKRGRRLVKAKEKKPGLNFITSAILRRCFFDAQESPQSLVGAVQLAYPDTWQSKPMISHMGTGGITTMTAADDIGRPDSVIKRNLRSALELLVKAENDPTQVSQQVKRLFSLIYQRRTLEQVKQTIEGWLA